MISAPQNLYGSDVFRKFVEELGGPKIVALFLDVTERTVWRWLAEDSVPKMAVLSLYWETKYGRSVIDTDHNFELSLLYGRIRILENQFAKASRIIAALNLLNCGTANQPFIDERNEFTRETEVARVG